MPVQTTLKADVKFPDGCKVLVSIDGGSVYTDIGAIMSAVVNTLTYTENRIQTANAGDLDVQLSNFKIEGSFTLINLNLENIAKISGGLFTVVSTPGSPITSFNDQVIATGQTEAALINLIPNEDTNNTDIKFSAAPVITSITGSVDGALTGDDDYYIHPDSNSFSGYSVSFHTVGTTLTTMAQTFTIVYGTNTPVESDTLYCGDSTKVLEAFIFKFEHTDDNGLTRTLELFAVDSTSGGFQFNYKGANEEGVEEMPITFMAKLDTSRDNGRQLLSWNMDIGAA